MSKIIGVSGHRPQRLQGGMTQLLAVTRGYLRDMDPDLVNVGMALGFDSMVVKACINLGLDYVAYVPFEGQEAKWSPDQQKQYKHFLHFAKEVKIVSPGGYSAKKMMLRNLAIVDDSTEMLVCWDGAKTGGTWNAIEATQEINHPVTNLWDDYISFKNSLSSFRD